MSPPALVALPRAALRGAAADPTEAPRARWNDNRVQEPAQETVTIGKTVDVELLPRAPGDLQLEVRTGAGRLPVCQPIRVAR